MTFSKEKNSLCNRCKVSFSSEAVRVKHYEGLEY